MISRPIQQVLRATEILRAGEGDLTRKIPDMPGEFGAVSISMNGFVSQLHDLVAQVALNASEIANAARQISAGNTDLSARTEEQASTLEQTASSMEQFTATIRQNAENTKLANGLALSASDAARKGGGVAEWIWKGAGRSGKARLDALFDNPKGSQPLRHSMAFHAVSQAFALDDEVFAVAAELFFE